MTFPIMFQASSAYKSCERKHSVAYGNYSGSARHGSAWLTCDYKAISVQLQLQLPTGTELGNNGIGLHGKSFQDQDARHFCDQCDKKKQEEKKLN